MIAFAVHSENHVWQNPKIHERWLYVADKIEREPELLSIPMKNIARWMLSERLPDKRWMVCWRAAIEHARASEEGMRELLDLLRDDGEKARQWKSASPFPGVLTKEERRMFSCAWTH